MMKRALNPLRTRPSSGMQWTLSACLILGLAWIATPTFAGPKDKIDICHISPDNPDHVGTIRVSEKAAANHILEHGDFEVGVECHEGVGECEMVGEIVCAPGVDVCTASPLFPPPEPQEASCEDGLDNDCDGLTDGEDSDCLLGCLADGSLCTIVNPGACCSKFCLADGLSEGVCY